MLAFTFLNYKWVPVCLSLYAVINENLADCNSTLNRNLLDKDYV